MIDANKAAIEENKGAITTAQSKADSAYDLASSASTSAESAYVAATARARTQIVSYTGTGTFGESNPCSVTFNFRPSYTIMLGWNDRNGNFTNAARSMAGAVVSILMVPFKQILSSSFTAYSGFGQELQHENEIFGKRSGNTLYWYIPGQSYYDPGKQFNSANYTYYVLAIE